ncbi:hypothetical protein F5879DRAFT_689872 [Lentinula edodes]|nr:hypothetical protein F5879DRAFT_689872 [Lentinula edodes]
MSSASQPGSSHLSAHNEPNYPQSPLSWEGDRMFNIYIYDYCFKRGFRKTARELLLEADLPPESQPPINARQGLLFEWWSVFWVLFTAKASGNGSDDALIYTQHQANQSNSRMRGQPLPPPGQPRPGVNGLPLPASRPFPATGPMTNGGPPGFPSGSHVNGIPQPPNQSFPQQPIAGPQRTAIGPRGSTGGGPPFPSPTMANSPHNPGQPPMNIGQSPHLNSRMPPPPPNGIHQGPGQIPGYPMNRPPSRTASPGQMGGMIHSSPSMSSRLVSNDPRSSQDPLTQELLRIPPAALSGLREELGLVGKEIQNMTLDEKQRINSMWRQKGPTGRKPGPPNAAAGPSTMHPPQRRTGKRNSTSPREDPDNVPGTGSPPTKKPRRSPVDPPPGPAYPQHAAQPGQPGSSMGPPGGPGPGPGPGPHQPTLGGMRPPMPSGGPPGGPMNVNGFGQPMGGMGGIGMNSMNGPAPPHTMNAMSPPMGGGMAGQPGMMTPQMQPMNPPGRPPPLDGPIQYRNSLANFHQRQLGGGGAGSPSDPGSTFGGGPVPGGPGPNNRISKHGPGLPMPPPSPGMNKDGSAKDMNMKIEGSPRGGLPPSSAGMTPTASGPANGPSSTPVPPGRPPSSQNPTPNSGPHPGMPSLPPPNMDPSPGSMLGNTPMSGMSGPMSGMPNGIGPGGMGSGMVGINSSINAMNGAGSDIPFFGSDFMNDIEVGGLDTFDPNLFRDPGGDLNFERDFGQWFNPNDQGLDDSLDPMK